MNKVIFDSANVNASSAFGLGCDEPNWDAMAEEAAFQDALDRGIVHSHGSIPAPAPSAKAEAEWTEAEWKRAIAFGLSVGNRRRPMVKAEVAVNTVETATTKHAAPSMADRLEWSMMTLSTAPVGSYFVQGEPGKFDATTRKPVSRVAARRTWQECRDADLDAVRPAGQAFDSPEWEGYFSQANVIESRYN